MESELARLRSSISLLQDLAKSLQEGGHVHSSEVLSITDTLPEIVSSLVQSDSSKDTSLLPKLGSALAAILSGRSPPVTRVPALSCLIDCLTFSNELIGIEKTKKRATSFAYEQFDHPNASVCHSCITWLSLLPSLLKPGPQGERFTLEWEQMVHSSLSSLQLALSTISPDLPPRLLSTDSPLPLSPLTLPSQLARRVESLFKLIVCLISRRSPARLLIPMESVLCTVTVATQLTSQDNQTSGPIAEVHSCAWRFLERVGGIIPSCLPPFSQPVAALFLRAMSTYKPGCALASMLQCLSTWFEVCQVGVSSSLLHQFLCFLKAHSTLRASSDPVPNRVKRRKTNSNLSEVQFLTGTDSVQLAIHCIGVCSSLVRNCVTEVSDTEYNGFMTHILSLLEDTSQLQTTCPTEPLIPAYISQLYSLVSDCILHSHPLTLSHTHNFIPHFKQGLSSPHAPTRQACRTGTLLIESISHPTLPPVKSAPNIPFVHTNAFTFPHTEPQEATSRSPLETVQTPHPITAPSSNSLGPLPPETSAFRQSVDGSNQNTHADSEDTSNALLNLETYNSVVNESIGCFIKSAIDFSDGDLLLSVSETERVRSATEAELNFDDIESSELSGMLNSFVEAEPDVVESTLFSL